MASSLRYFLVFGSLAGLIIVLLSTAAVLSGALGHSSSPVMGYLVMLVGLTMIFVGVKRFRDVECGGVIRFGRALLVGLGIGLAAAIIYAAAFELYVAATGFDFVAWFAEIRARELAAAGTDPAAVEREMAALRAFGADYARLSYRLPLHFLEIAPAWLLVALASAAILRNPRVLPARA